jgi:hypothetical protein
MNVRTFGRTAALGACMIALAAAGACGKKDNDNHNAATTTTNRAVNTTTTNTSTTSTASADDANIRAKATQNLEKKGITGVTVTVNNGELTASGTVPSAKWTDAMQALNEAGAKRVDNSKLVKGS